MEIQLELACRNAHQNLIDMAIKLNKHLCGRMHPPRTPPCVKEASWCGVPTVDVLPTNHNVLEGVPREQVNWQEARITSWSGFFFVKKKGGGSGPV